METIIISKVFSHRLQNRNKHQGDGSFNGEDFRNKYLKNFDNESIWKTPDKDIIILDFEGVTRLGPSWANEVFAYFTQYAKPDLILEKIKIINITQVKFETIKKELDEGYKPSAKK